MAKQGIGNWANRANRALGKQGIGHWEECSCGALLLARSRRDGAAMMKVVNETLHNSRDCTTISICNKF